MPKSALNGCTLQVRPVLSKMKACLPKTIMLAWESSSDLGSAVPSSLVIADTIRLVICAFGTILISGEGCSHLFLRILCNFTDVVGNAAFSALA
jgi:hypothetical protein